MTSPTDPPGPGVVIWQGYHHAWDYNHRLNRFGSYVTQGDGNGRGPRVVHTAASGTGPDIAHFKEFATYVEAKGVAFQVGVAETLIECPRTESTPFRIKLDKLELDPALQGKQVYAVLLNGFDIYADDHADKLIAFDLEVSDPVAIKDGRQIRFSILGSMCVDCRSPECQLWPLRLEAERIDQKEIMQEEEPDPELIPQGLPHKASIDRRKVERAFNWVKQQLVRVTGLEEVKRSVIGKDEDTLRRRLFRIFKTRFFLKLLKWRITTPYVLRVHYVIVAGTNDSLAVSESDFFENSYDWDMESEIHLSEIGTQDVSVPARKNWSAATLGFKHLSLQVTLDEEHGSSDPIQWGKGMHFLEWSSAIRSIRFEDQQVKANLDLFYKCWSAAMNEMITLVTWGAFRAAGRATLGARLTLLQFRDGTVAHQQQIPGRLYWPGGGRSAKRDPRGRSTRKVPIYSAASPDGDDAV
ncbi:MAG: hypothetical protein GYB68_18200 [Chloroflexi bacterium]|nr:hypothetical protein [Chloroflexota bacterium]